MLQRILFFFLLIATACQPATKEQAKLDPSQPAWNLFIGTYTKKEGHVDGKAKGLYVYRMAEQDGQLEKITTIEGLVNPSFVSASLSGRHLLAVEETVAGEDTSGHVNLFERSEDGSYRLLSRQSTHGFAPCHVSTDQVMQFAYVANYLGGVAMYPLQNGALQPACFVIRQNGSGPHKEQEASHPHQAMVSPNDHFLYVPDKGADRIFGYAIERVQRRLIPLPDSLQARTAAGAGPRHLAFHPVAPFAYVVNELNGTVTALSYNASNGALKPIQSISTLPDGFKDFNACADIHITPDGRYLYASNRGHNSLAIFSINAQTGELTAIGHESVHGAFPRNFAISPDGRHILVANQNSDNLVLFAIQPDGKLQFVRETKEMTPVCLLFR